MARCTAVCTAYWAGSDGTIRDTVPLSHEVQKYPFAFQAPAQRGVHLELDPDFIPDMVNGLCLSGYTCAINPLYHLAKMSKFSMLLLTYWGSVAARDLSTLRNNLKKHPHSMGDPVVQPAACRRAQRALGCPLFMISDNRLIDTFVCWLQKLGGLINLDLGQTLTSTMVGRGCTWLRLAIG